MFNQHVIQNLFWYLKVTIWNLTIKTYLKAPISKYFQKPKAQGILGNVEVSVSIPHWGGKSLQFLGCACFAEILSELTKTWSSGATNCRLCIGNCNVNVWKSTEHKLHKIWRSLNCQQNEHTPANEWLINLYISWLYAPF